MLITEETVLESNSMSFDAIEQEQEKARIRYRPTSRKELEKKE